MLRASTSSRLSELDAKTHLEAGMGVVEVGVIAGQVQLDIEVITVYRLVRLTCCAHVHLQQGVTLSVSLKHDAPHIGGCLTVEWLNGWVCSLQGMTWDESQLAAPLQAIRYPMRGETS